MSWILFSSSWVDFIQRRSNELHKKINIMHLSCAKRLSVKVSKQRNSGFSPTYATAPCLDSYHKLGEIFIQTIGLAHWVCTEKVTFCQLNFLLTKAIKSLQLWQHFLQGLPVYVSQFGALCELDKLCKSFFGELDLLINKIRGVIKFIVSMQENAEHVFIFYNSTIVLFIL